MALFLRPCELSSQMQHVVGPLNLQLIVAPSMLIDYSALQKIKRVFKIRPSFRSGRGLSAISLCPGEEVGDSK